MQFIPEAWRDIDRYYRDTWVKFQEFGERLFYIHNVSSEQVTGKDQDGDEFVLYLTNEMPYTLSYVLPHRAVFQHKGEAFILQRMPARQYKRGLSSENTIIKRVVDNKTVDFRIEYLTAYVNKQSYASLRSVLFESSKSKSVALGGRFAFDRLEQRLFLDSKPIARFYRDQNAFRILSLFKPELEELIRIDPFETSIHNVEAL